MRGKSTDLQRKKKKNQETFYRVFGRVLLENYEGLSIKDKLSLTDTLSAVSRVWESCYEDFWGEADMCLDY